MDSDIGSIWGLDVNSIRQYRAVSRGCSIKWVHIQVLIGLVLFINTFTIIALTSSNQVVVLGQWHRLLPGPGCQ